MRHLIKIDGYWVSDVSDDIQFYKKPRWWTELPTTGNFIEVWWDPEEKGEKIRLAIFYSENGFYEPILAFRYSEKGSGLVETKELASLLEVRLQEGETLKLELLPTSHSRLSGIGWRDTEPKEIVIKLNSFVQIPPSVSEIQDYVLKRLGIEEPS